MGEAVRQGAAGLVERTPIPIILFLIAGVLPTPVGFYLGTLRLSPYRVLLVAMTPFLLIQLISGMFGKVTLSDRLVIASTVWMWGALFVCDGASAIESGGIMLLETFGAYLVARCFIRSAGQWLATVRCMAIIIACMSPLIFMETLSGEQLMQLFVVGRNPDGTVPEGFKSIPRMGFYRASGPFDHPILLGVIAAAVTSAVTMAAIRKRSLMILTPFCLLATMCSISSGALASLCVAGLLAAWERVMKSTPRRWIVFLILISVAFGIIELLSNRSGVVAILSVVTLDPKTALDRTIIWDWGFHHNVLVNPWFGLGRAGVLNWVRPGWLGSSVDNYFLLLMMVHGIVAVVLLLLGIIVRTRSAVLATAVPAVHGLAWSWWIPMFGFVIAGWTVAFWNHAQIFFWFFIGAGSWIEQAYLADKSSCTPGRRKSS